MSSDDDYYADMERIERARTKLTEAAAELSAVINREDSPFRAQYLAKVEKSYSRVLKARRGLETTGR